MIGLFCGKPSSILNAKLIRSAKKFYSSGFDDVQDFFILLFMQVS